MPTKAYVLIETAPGKTKDVVTSLRGAPGVVSVEAGTGSPWAILYLPGVTLSGSPGRLQLSTLANVTETALPSTATATRTPTPAPTRTPSPSPAPEAPKPPNVTLWTIDAIPAVGKM